MTTLVYYIVECNVLSEPVFANDEEDVVAISVQYGASRFKVLWAKETDLPYPEFLNDAKPNDRIKVQGHMFVKPWMLDKKNGVTVSVLANLIEPATLPSRAGIKGCSLKRARPFDSGRGGKFKFVKALQAKISADEKVESLGLSEEVKEILSGIDEGRLEKSLEQFDDYYNILFIGEVQSGKSTLIEALMQYANPDYRARSSRLGSGANPHTASTIVSYIETDFPSILLTGPSKDARIFLDDFENMDTEDVEDTLNDISSYSLYRESSGYPKTSYRLIDTPGFNNTIDDSAASDLFGSIKSISHLNMIIITVRKTPFTPELMAAFRKHLEVLSTFKGHIVFVHTDIDYTKVQTGDDDFAFSHDEKKTIIQEIVGEGGDQMSHFVVNNDLRSKKMAQKWIAQNTLRELLLLARSNTAVPMPVSMTL
ncbi:hypothetical protein BG005_011280 [Podila minutissima]|nr:hypothetical protein BG005_011280 [Podila minutissima]